MLSCLVPLQIVARLARMLTGPLGYTLILWHDIMGWPKDEYQVCLMNMRKALNNKRYHAYLNLRYVYARKSDSENTKEE